MATDYTPPQVNIYQELTASPVEGAIVMRAHISGPNAVLHRYAVAAEKALIELGSYNRLLATTYLWPGRLAGSLVDLPYVKLFVDNALLMYLEDTIGSGSTVSSVAGTSNRIKSNTLSFKSNGTAYPRSAALNDRDVQIGDPVHLRSVGPTPDCVETTLNTYVTGFASNSVPAVVSEAREDIHNVGNKTHTISITKLDSIGSDVVTATVTSPSTYNGLADGDVNESYTIEVTLSSIPGCSAAALRVTSASGHDDVASVTPSAFGTVTNIGTRGVKVTFHGNPSTDTLLVGQKWRVDVTQDFAIVFAEAAGTYAGDQDDTYIIEVTKGGIWASDPQITVTTAKGLDFSGPTTITAPNTLFPIGSQGVTVAFFGQSGDPGSSASLDFDQTVPALRKGDKFYITVTGVANGAVHQLILRDDLPTAMLAAADMDLRLFIKANIQVTEDRLGAAPLTNWDTTATQLIVNDGVTAYHPEWTEDGVELPLPMWDGDLFAEYREWVVALTDAVGSINDIADIDSIPGALDPDNPLKYGVAKALSNSNSTDVLYTAVADPDSLDSWLAVLSRIKGNNSIYNLVPMTFRRDVQDAYAAHCVDESGPFVDNWKAMFAALQALTSQAVVSQVTSLDGHAVLGTIADNPSAAGTQYTYLQVPAANSGFIQNGVQPGDVVRTLYTVDGFGNATWTEFVVDAVLSESTLVLFTGNATAVTEPQKLEVWHTLSKDELAANLSVQGSSFGSIRVCPVWPDTIGEAGLNVPGYFVAAGLAGEVSGVVPQQGLTNSPLLGFDDASRSAKFFNSDQLNTIAGGGVWIVTQSRDGTIYTRHGLTSDRIDLNHQEEMIRRNLDSISYQFLNDLQPLIGRSNITPSLLDYVRYVVGARINLLKAQGATQLLGGQIIDGTIVVLQQDPLLKDHLNIVVDLTGPDPTNTISLHLSI